MGGASLQQGYIAIGNLFTKHGPHDNRERMPRFKPPRKKIVFAFASVLIFSGLFLIPTNSDRSRTKCEDFGYRSFSGAKYDGKPLITLFTTFKEDKGRIDMHSLAVKNWASLQPYVKPVLFSTQTSGILVDLASEHGWDILPSPGVNSFGTPFVKAMYVTAYNKYNTSLYAYSNGDLLYSNDFIETLRGLVDHFVSPLNPPNPPFVIARRCNIQLDGTQSEDLWRPDVVKRVANETNFHGVDAFDIFMTTKWGFPMKRIPDIVVGRGGIGQFLYLAAEYFNLTTVDSSATNRILHLQGKDKLMTHKTDENPDMFYNLQLLQREFGEVPYWMCLTSATSAYTDYDAKTGCVEVRTRYVPRIGDYQTVRSLKFKERYDDDHVLKHSLVVPALKSP